MKTFLISLAVLFFSAQAIAGRSDSSDRSDKPDVGKSEFSVSWGIGGLWLSGGRNPNEQGYAVIGLAEEFHVAGGFSAGVGARFFAGGPWNYSIVLLVGYTHWESNGTFAEYIAAGYGPRLSIEPWSYSLEAGGKFLIGNRTLFRLGAFFLHSAGIGEHLPATAPAVEPGLDLSRIASPDVNALGVHIGFSFLL